MVSSLSTFSILSISMYFYRETDESLTKKQSVPGVSVKKPTNRIADKYAISKEEFNSETVSIMF